jgi:hypothetical protein
MCRFIGSVTASFGILIFSVDEILICGFLLCIIISFLYQIPALHYIINDKKIWSDVAFVFNISYVVFVIFNYVVQLFEKKNIKMA